MATHHAAALSSPRTPHWTAAHEALSRLARQRATLDAEEGRWLLLALRAEAHAHLGFGSFCEYVERLFGYKPRTTQEKLRVAEALEGLPGLADALASGTLGWCAARELTRVAVPETEQAWLAVARGKTQRALEALVSDKSPGDAPDAPGQHVPRRHVLRFEVSADTLATFRDAVQHLQRAAGGRLDHDALLLTMARHILGGPSDDGRSSYQVSLHVCAACGGGAQVASGELVQVDPAVIDMAECDAQRLGEVMAPTGAQGAAHWNATPAAQAERNVDADDPDQVNAIAPVDAIDESTAARYSSQTHVGARTRHAGDDPRRMPAGDEDAKVAAKEERNVDTDGPDEANAIDESTAARCSSQTHVGARASHAEDDPRRMPAGDEGTAARCPSHVDLGARVECEARHLGAVPPTAGAQRPANENAAPTAREERDVDTDDPDARDEVDAADESTAGRCSSHAHVDARAERDAQHLGALLPLAGARGVANQDGDASSASAERNADRDEADAPPADDADDESAAGRGSSQLDVGVWASRAENDGCRTPAPSASPPTSAAASGIRARALPRARQSIPPALRRAVLDRDRRRCQVPGCTHTTYVDVHHLQRLADGGLNVLWNLLTLCSAHHRATHRGELLIERGADGALVFRHADGSLYGHLVSPPRIDVQTKVFSALKHLGFREREVKAVLDELRADAALADATAERLLREALCRIKPTAR